MWFTWWFVNVYAKVSNIVSIWLGSAYALRANPHLILSICIGIRKPERKLWDKSLALWQCFTLLVCRNLICQKGLCGAYLMGNFFWEKYNKIKAEGIFVCIIKSNGHWNHTQIIEFAHKTPCGELSYPKNRNLLKTRDNKTIHTHRTMNTLGLLMPHFLPPSAMHTWKLLSEKHIVSVALFFVCKTHE